MLKICTPDPDMYNMKAFIGMDFAGAKATSHARFCLRASTSALEGGLRDEEALFVRCISKKVQQITSCHY